MLKLSRINKYFKETGIQACKNINLSIQPHSIVAIVGENGAGKSTLMNILCGTTSPDSGEIFLNNTKIRTSTALASSKAGIGMVHQHPLAADSLTVLENIILGYEPRILNMFIDYKKALKEIQKIQDLYKLPLDLHLKGEDLNSAQIQRMELIHLLCMKKSVLIFDEPTASLSDFQIEEFLSTMKKLKDEGKSIIFITHKLTEVFQCADAIVVMRKGKITFEEKVENITSEQIALEMIGSPEEIIYPKSKRILDNRSLKKLYKIEGLYYKKNDRKFLKNINLHINQGEILGIAGIRENGLEILEDIISGMCHPHTGKLILNGEDVTDNDPSHLRRKGISYIPADRLNRGVSKNSTIAENLILLNYKRMHKLGILAPESINKWAESLQNTYKIEGKPHQQIKHLSGGNIQKVILSRELRENPDLIIICEPSWGLDFRSRNQLHEELIQTAQNGTSILLISSDLDEILALSDRIAVLYDGEINICKTKNEMSRILIGEYMLGIKNEKK